MMGVLPHHSSTGEVRGTLAADRRDLKVTVPGTMGCTHPHPVLAKLFLFVVSERPEEGLGHPVTLFQTFGFAAAMVYSTSVFLFLRTIFLNDGGSLAFKCCHQ